MEALSLQWKLHSTCTRPAKDKSINIDSLSIQWKAKPGKKKKKTRYDLPETSADRIVGRPVVGAQTRLEVAQFPRLDDGLAPPKT